MALVRNQKKEIVSIRHNSLDNIREVPAYFGCMAL